MDGLYAGIKIYNEKNGTTVTLLGWDAATQTGTFVGGDNPWGDPAKGEQLAKTFLDQGADIVHPSPARPATARSRPCWRPASGRSASTPTRPSRCPSTQRRS